MGMVVIQCKQGDGSGNAGEVCTVICADGTPCIRVPKC